jgi:hypothetical protein
MSQTDREGDLQLNGSTLKRLLVALGVAAGVITATASQASAALNDTGQGEPPVHFSSTEEEELTYNCEGGAVLTELGRATVSGRDFYTDGVLTRTLVQVSFDGVITNERTGEQFRDSNHFSYEIDWLANTVTVRGVWYQIHNLEGGPVLLLDAGSITSALDTGDVIRGSAKHPSLSPNLYVHPAQVLCEAIGA